MEAIFFIRTLYTGDFEQGYMKSRPFKCDMYVLLEEKLIKNKLLNVELLH